MSKSLTPSIIDLLVTAKFERSGTNVYVSKSRVDGRTIKAMERRGLVNAHSTYYSYSLTPNGVEALDEVRKTDWSGEIQNEAQEAAWAYERKLAALKVLPEGTEVTVVPDAPWGRSSEEGAQPWKAAFIGLLIGDPNVAVVQTPGYGSRQISVSHIQFDGYAATSW